MKYLIDIVYILVLVLLSPKIIYRAIKQDRYRTGWSQRFGKVSRKYPDKKCIWIHAVSVGEVNATKTLIAELTDQLNDYEVVISTTTDTGYARANALYAENHSVFFYPADISWVVKRALKRLKPDICLLMELEVWPNLAAIAKDYGIPTVVVNGRLSDKSFPRYQKIKAATRWMFSKVTLILAQTNEYADRFIALGCDRKKVIVTSSLKYDTAQVLDAVQGADQLKEQISLKDNRLWVVGGTGPGEEDIALKVYTKLKSTDGFDDVKMAIIPRKPERFNEVAQLIQSSKFSSIRYSELKDGSIKTDTQPDIILGDTMGDLKKFYSLASTVLVGRTMAPMGGSDMMEPAALGKFTMFGEHTFNFKQTVDALLKGNGAVEINSSDHLLDVLVKSLTDNDYAAQIARNGQAVIIQNQGATQKTIEAVKSILK